MAVSELVLVRQTSLHEEKVTKNGSTYMVHVVVKNSPFQVALALKSPKGGDSFSNCAYDIRLVYDESADNKEVAFVKVKPVEYKPTINDAGDQISFDVKIKVLSSHHEDNFFRLKIEVWDPNAPAHKLSALSAPIKVISKPLKHRKKAAAASANNLAQNGAYEPSEGAGGKAGGVKRSNVDRSNDDEYLVQRMNDILEEQQQTRDEVRQLRQLLAIQMGVGDGDLAAAAAAGDYSALGPPPAKRIKTENGDNESDKDFESLFSRLIQVYSTLEVEEKTEKTRKMLRTMSGREAEMLVEMFDLLNAAGLQGEAQKAMYGISQPLLMGMPPIGPTTPHQMSFQGSARDGSVEMARQLDQFYNEVFF